MIMPAAIATAITIPIPMYYIYLEPPIVSIVGFVIFANYVTSFKLFDKEIIISVLCALIILLNFLTVSASANL